MLLLLNIGPRERAKGQQSSGISVSVESPLQLSLKCFTKPWFQMPNSSKLKASASLRQPEQIEERSVSQTPGAGVSMGHCHLLEHCCQLANRSRAELLLRERRWRLRGRALHRGDVLQPFVDNDVHILGSLGSWHRVDTALLSCGNGLPIYPDCSLPLLWFQYTGKIPKKQTRMA